MAVFLSKQTTEKYLERQIRKITKKRGAMSEGRLAAELSVSRSVVSKLLRRLSMR